MSEPSEHVIWLHQNAPSKPKLGAPCNGCGVCCAAQPCPVAALTLRQTRGACRALEWDGALYRCGMLLAPRKYVRWLPALFEPAFKRMIRRWIAAGVACDSEA
jgi:hypothetical protein